MIAISAGHYPTERGAQNADGLSEYPATLDWASKIVNMLYSPAMLVASIGLRGKVRCINRLPDVKLALEVHFNDALSSGVRGSETLYCPGSQSGIRLAAKMQVAIAPFALPDRGFKPGYYRMDPARGPDRFLARTKCTALIIEPGFIEFYDEFAPNMDAICGAVAHVLDAAYAHA